MACSPEALYSTAVFASYGQLPLMGSAPAQYGDVFARQERRATAASTLEARKISIPLLIGDTGIKFTYLDFGGGLPAWASPVLRSVANRWGIDPGWDSYAAEPTNPGLVVDLLNILSVVMTEGSLAPLVTPLADGGVQAEWHSQRRDLEIVVAAGRRPTYYYFDETAPEQEEEGDLEPAYARAQDLIGRFS